MQQNDIKGLDPMYKKYNPKSKMPQTNQKRCTIKNKSWATVWIRVHFRTIPRVNDRDAETPI